MTALLQSSAWRALQDEAGALRDVHLRELFAREPGRAEVFHAQAAGLTLDYSKQRITLATREKLLALAAQQQLGTAVRRMFDGEIVNPTEQRPALHVALRAPREAKILVQGRDVVADVHEVLDRMSAFAEAVRSGAWTGHDGARITDVVNIGIGGSDLGPRMVCEVLAPLADGPRAHFVANVDGAPIARLLAQLDPARTLFVITSKTFTTQETMANAQAARAWFLRSGNEADIAKHFVAVSTNQAAAAKFGIADANVFGFWDWVGGRYSLWSAVGLSILLALGPARFRALLDGARAMDEHFASAPPEQNLPVLLGLLSVWNVDFLGSASQVIAPYAQDLERLVSWLQQLEMESNAKRVDRDGEDVDYRTTPALWGDVGTNAQHAFFQMLHQSPDVHPVDFILPLAAEHDLADQHRMLVTNCLAQSAALMSGRTAAEVRVELAGKGLAGAALEAAIPHRVFPGNRPSNTILLARLDPFHLGSLLALYEHRTYVQSVIWNINAFDQWGVELGKVLASNILRAMAGEAVDGLDASTRKLLEAFKASAGD